MWNSTFHGLRSRWRKQNSFRFCLRWKYCRAITLKRKPSVDGFRKSFALTKKANMKSVSDIQLIQGRCHCGNINVVLKWPDPPEKIPVRVCGCTLCQKHRAAWTSVPAGDFDLKIKNRNQVSFYKFGTETADFCVCTLCGVMPIATCVINKITYSVVNANTFVDIDASQLSPTSTNFDGEDTDSRLARRARNWTPQLIS